MLSVVSTVLDVACGECICVRMCRHVCEFASVSESNRMTYEEVNCLVTCRINCCVGSSLTASCKSSGVNMHCILIVSDQLHNHTTHALTYTRPNRYTQICHQDLYDLMPAASTYRSSCSEAQQAQHVGVTAATCGQDSQSSPKLGGAMTLTSSKFQCAATLGSIHARTPLNSPRRGPASAQQPSLLVPGSNS